MFVQPTFFLYTVKNGEVKKMDVRNTQNFGESRSFLK